MYNYKKIRKLLENNFKNSEALFDQKYLIQLLNNIHNQKDFISIFKITTELMIKEKKDFNVYVSEIIRNDVTSKYFISNSNTFKMLFSLKLNDKLQYFIFSNLTKNNIFIERKNKIINQFVFQMKLKFKEEFRVCLIAKGKKIYLSVSFLQERNGEK